MEWGVGIAWKAAQGLAEAAQDYLPQNERSEMFQKIAGLIRRRGLVKPRDIQMYIRGRLKSGEIKGILEQLVGAGEIERMGRDYKVP
jgi:hypothetical protein